MEKNLLDPNNPQHTHAEQRLNSDSLIWLGSVRPDGQPHLVPVWFLWQAGELYILTQPGSQKVRNLKANPQVTLALQAASDGGDIVILEGTVEFMEPGDLIAITPAYEKKYQELIAGLGMNMEKMAADYSQLLKVKPARFIIW